ncbi:MAG: hypothetical protein RJB39_443 [Candidatus Parcubacteria bacterium]|jgi:ATP-binding cassette subfamily B protein
MTDSKNSKLTYELGVGYDTESAKVSTWRSGKEFFAFIKADVPKIIFAFIFILLNSVASIVTPFIIAKAVDTYIATKDLAGLPNVIWLLVAIYVVTIIAGYVQGIMMGMVSQRTLYRLRESVFTKLQSLPIAFFNQNKAGDLMSRVNNDTDKLNQFLSEGVARFFGTFFSLVGVAGFVLYINWKLGLVMLAMTVVLVIFVRLMSPHVRRKSKESLTAVGNFSSVLQENLNNFRVVVAYGKRDYFRDHLDKAAYDAFVSAKKAARSYGIFEPIFDFGGNITMLALLSVGMYMIGTGEITVGILIAFLAYSQRFYSPLLYMAGFFANVQTSTAAWSRIREILTLKNNLEISDGIILAESANRDLRIELADVSFHYEGGNPVIENANLQFQPGKTYALVGPTGGGKSTLASLMAHLYDPTTGVVFLNGRDIRTYSDADRAKEISVILQDPILFTGNVAENITYGNEELKHISLEKLEAILVEKGFKDVISRFESGLNTAISQSGAGLSIGQKQLISFMRAILRAPKLLILDEATANIDTVTEAMLNKTLEALPKDTTKVIIAHRLNTIKEADDIMFVNGHHVTRAGSYEDAIGLIEKSKRTS